jgi:hypothetical protein
MLEIDHVIAVVADLDTAAAVLFDRYGLASVAGGRHTGHGTGNRIVPLGTTYIELMAVIDPGEAAGSPMGRWALDHIDHETVRPISLCLRTDQISHIAATLDEEPLAMSRETPDGTRLSWHLAGFDAMVGPRRLPFFIQWEGDAHPGATPAPHRLADTGITSVTIGDPGELRSLVEAAPGLTIGDGVGVQNVVIATSRGEITLG